MVAFNGKSLPCGIQYFLISYRVWHTIAYFYIKSFPLFWNKYPGSVRRMRAQLTHNAQLMGIHLPQYFLLDASGTKYCIVLPSKEHKHSLIYIVKAH